jgi:hypothetical protein
MCYLEQLYLGGMEEIIFILKNRRRGGSDRYKNYDSFTIVGIYSLSCDFLASINHVKGNRIISKFLSFSCASCENHSKIL